MTFASRLNAILAAHGMSQTDLAKLLGVTSQAVSQWVNGVVEPRGHRVAAIAKALGVRVIDLIGDGELPPPPNRPAPENNVSPSPYLPPARQDMPRDVPVFGSAQGGPEGSFELNMEGGPIDWARRLPAVIGIKDAFCIYVEGDSMVPWRQPGELAYVNPRRSPQVGDHIIIELRGEPGHPPASIVKRLVRRTATRWIIAQYNPAMEIEVPVDTIARCFRVMEWSELLGA